MGEVDSGAACGPQLAGWALVQPEANNGKGGYWCNPGQGGRRKEWWVGTWKGCLKVWLLHWPAEQVSEVG